LGRRDLRGGVLPRHRVARNTAGADLSCRVTYRVEVTVVASLGEEFGYQLDVAHLRGVVQRECADVIVVVAPEHHPRET